MYPQGYMYPRLGTPVLEEPPSGDCLEQLCPTDKQKDYVTVFMRAAL